MTEAPATKAVSVNDPDLFMAMENLELAARGIVEGALHGMHRSPYLGFSAEFDAHREYAPGDDLRYVNWNLWGRTDRLYIKQYKADTNLNVYLLLDISRSMLCDHGPDRKWRYAARIMAALAFLALNSRDATGLFLLGDGIENVVPPVVRPGQFHEILAVLERLQPRGRLAVRRAFDETLQLCRRRGLVVFISDLFEDDDALFRGLDNLRHAGHDVLVLQLLDPWEAELPDSGQFEFEDLESGERMKIHAAAYNAEYRKTVAAWRGAWQQRCEGSGIDWLSYQTNEPLRDMLIDYLLKRAGMN